ncbi:MAG: type II toxin-antitoxin system VapC family toxin [Rubrobacter sp.]|nr:type II toxin-antitoxin system VapC family toxin [Rubrobacter sp.]
MSDQSGSSYLVVDTNVAIKWYLTEELEDEALSVLEVGERGDLMLLAPDSVEPEFWNVLWQRHRRGELSLDEVWEYWDALEESPLLMGEVLPLMTLATRIAADSGCIIYDALFVALAEFEDTVVVTADQKLLDAIEGTSYAKRGVHLRDVTHVLPRL